MRVEITSDGSMICDGRKIADAAARAEIERRVNDEPGHELIVAPTVANWRWLLGAEPAEPLV